jgi:hypothetical protein
MGKMTITGDAPFDLGLAQDASAQPSNGSLELTLRIVLEGQGPKPKPVRVRMTNDVALKASAALAKAAIAKK